MKAGTVIVLIVALAVAAVVFITRHREHAAELAAARLTHALERTPALVRASGVRRNGALVSVWFLDTLSPDERSQLDHIVAEEGKPVQVTLVPLQLIDPVHK